LNPNRTSPESSICGLLDGDPESASTLARSADWIPTEQIMAPTTLERAVADRDALIVYIELASDQLDKIDHEPLDQDEIQNLIELMSNTQTDLMDINRRIIGAAPADLEDHKQTFKTLYANCMKLSSKLRSLITSPAPAMAASSASHSEVRLPRLELPYFDGDLLQWISFRDIFQSAIHNKANLSDAQKLTYLKGQLRGEASRLIQSMLITDSNYQIAWDQLQSRYQNDREILYAILRRFDHMPSSLPHSHSSVRHIIDTSRECIRSLQVLMLPVDQWDAILLFYIVKKLDHQCKQLWEQSLQDSSVPPLSSLFDFLEQRARALAAGSTESKGSRPTNRDDRPKYNANSVTSLHVTGSSCVVCKGPYHPLFKCQSFVNLDLQTRMNTLRSSKSCFNCLASSHSVSKCPSTRTCKKCDAKHHTLIHQDSLSPRENPSRTVTHHVQQPVNRPNSSASPPGNYSISQTDRLGPLLSTARVRAQDSCGQLHTFRILLDNGSNTNFVTEACIQTLGLPLSRCINPATGLNGTPLVTTTKSTEMTLIPHFESNVSYKATLNVIPKITNQLPQSAFNLKKYKHLNITPLADPWFHIPQDIDMLLGAEFFYFIIQPKKRSGPHGAPVAISTTFGWIVGGGSSAAPDESCALHVMRPGGLDSCLDDLLTRFWKQEEIHEPSNSFSSSEQKCVDHFIRTHRQLETGQFVVQLPFKDSPDALGLSLKSATRRLKSMEKRLTENPSHYDEYIKFMQEYENLGHMVEIPAESSENPPHTYYIPHHFVLKKDSTSTKFRVVFDASAKTSTGVSLNDTMLVGPTIQDSLMNIVIRFRLHKVAFIADIRKMYRQILVDPQQTDLQRIVWRNHPTDEIKHYRLLTVTYGTASAPYLATATLKQLAQNKSEEIPLGALIVQRDFYVDDLMSGCPSVSQAICAQSQLQELCSAGHFSLLKWSSNSQELLQHIPIELQETKVPIMENDQVIKTLGISWLPKKDVFTFRYSPAETTKSAPKSKRQILAEISSLFDPVGWLAPVVIKAKLLMQKIHLANSKWDDPVPNNLQESWEQLCLDLNQNLPKLEIPRHYLYGSSIPDAVSSTTGSESFHLLGFSDASEKAYAAVVYLAAYMKDTPVSISLVTSKTRVAPSKSQSLPRLELCGALLLAELMSTVDQALKINITSKHYWSDSTITLSWIKGQPSKWKTYVANRVSKIQQVSDPQFWKFVPGIKNPSDCASRGVSVADLITHPLWWRGPASIPSLPQLLNADLAPQPIGLEEICELKKETKPPVQLCNLTTDSWPMKIIQRFSTLTRLRRVTAYMLRFLNKKSSSSVKNCGPLTSDELQNAFLVWVRLVQVHCFREEIKSLQYGKPLHSKSNILSLNPYLDTTNVLRVGGRLRNSSLTENAKHPILLPRKSHLTYLVMHHSHLCNLHSGIQQMMTFIRQNFWILRAKDEIKYYIKRCVLCTRLKAETMKQLMGNLPAYRVNPSRPFLKCGVDYCGPFLIRPIQPRSKVVLKAYIAVFVCFSVRAIHLEVVSDLTSSAFIACFRRFVARRGLPSEIRSDCGTNFVGADKELRQLHKMTMEKRFQSEICDQTTDAGTQWFFNPPASPHFGGLWEAGVKSLKYHLRRIMGNQRLTFEELTTIVTQIEAILNSRPLCPVSSDPEDLSVLTPGHFLIGCPLNSLPDADTANFKVSLLNRWQFVQKSTQDFWNRWSKEYLTRLQHRPKWMVTQRSVKLGDMVIIKDENLPPLRWRLGRVIELHPGADAIIRVVTVKTHLGITKRPIVKLCLLPFNTDDS